MAAPTVTARANSQHSSAATTTHTVALPDTLNVGERIIVSFVSLRGGAGPGLSVPEGWNVIGSGGLGGAAGVWHAVVEHVIDGEEDDTVEFTTSSSTVSCHRTWAGPFQEAVIAGPETANANTATYPEVEVDEGDYLVLAICGTQTGAQGMTISTPADYGEAFVHNTGNNGAAQGTFERSLLGITSEQPGASTLGSSERSACFTVAYAAAETGGEPREVEATTAAAVVTAQAATVVTTRAVQASTAAASATALPAAVNRARGVQAGTETLALAAQPATVQASTNRIVQATTAAAAVAGQAATVNRSLRVSATTEALTLAAQAAVVARGEDREVAARTAALSLEAPPALVNRTRRIEAATSAAAIAAQAATVRRVRAVRATSADLSVAAQQALINRTRAVQAMAEALVLFAPGAVVIRGTLVSVVGATATVQALTPSASVTVLDSPRATVKVAG